MLATTTPVISIETEADVVQREALLDLSFGRAARLGKTSERLREGRKPAHGLAFAAHGPDGRLVGTLRLWHVSAGPDRAALLLGPLAVHPWFRDRGLGRGLMNVAISEAARLGHGAIMLVGDAPYYARFGFDPALTEGLWLPGSFDRARFLGLELRAGALSGARGLVSAAGDMLDMPSLAELMAHEDVAELRRSA